MKDDTDYRRKYEDAIKRAEKEILACGSLDCDAARLIYRIFPVEFTSEDERIRKALLNEFTHLLSKGCNKFAGLKHEDIITWLEKQGEMDIKKPITIGKCKLTGKAAELAKEVTPESLEETRKKLIAEEKHWQDVRERAAIAAMQGTIHILGSSDRYAFREVVVEGYSGNEKTYPKEIAEFAVACADALIEKLKKE